MIRSICFADISVRSRSTPSALLIYPPSSEGFESRSNARAFGLVSRQLFAVLRNGVGGRLARERFVAEHLLEPLDLGIEPDRSLTVALAHERRRRARGRGEQRILAADFETGVVDDVRVRVQLEQ